MTKHAKQTHPEVESTQQQTVSDHVLLKSVSSKHYFDACDMLPENAQSEEFNAPRPPKKEPVSLQHAHTRTAGRWNWTEEMLTKEAAKVQGETQRKRWMKDEDSWIKKN